MSVDQLRRVLGIPSHPLGTGSLDEWKSIEKALGGILPADYKEFISTYGVGCIDGFLWVFSPFTTNENLNLMTRPKVMLNSLRELRDNFGEQLDFPLFPDDHGVFPWGVTDNGDELYWQFSQGGFHQPVIVAESRGPMWEDFDLSTTDFLAGVLAQQITVKEFPADFPSAKPTFLSGD